MYEVQICLSSSQMCSWRFLPACWRKIVWSTPTSWSARRWRLMSFGVPIPTRRADQRLRREDHLLGAVAALHEILAPAGPSGRGRCRARHQRVHRVASKYSKFSKPRRIASSDRDASRRRRPTRRSR